MSKLFDQINLLTDTEREQLSAYVDFLLFRRGEQVEHTRVAKAACTESKQEDVSFPEIPNGFKKRLAAIPMEKRTFFTTSLENALPMKLKEEVAEASVPGDLWRGEFLSYSVYRTHPEIVDAILNYFKV